MPRSQAITKCAADWTGQRTGCFLYASARRPCQPPPNAPAPPLHPQTRRTAPWLISTYDIDGRIRPEACRWLAGSLPGAYHELTNGGPGCFGSRPFWASSGSPALRPGLDCGGTAQRRHRFGTVVAPNASPWAETGQPHHAQHDMPTTSVLTSGLAPFRSRIRSGHSAARCCAGQPKPGWHQRAHLEPLPAITPRRFVRCAPHATGRAPSTPRPRRMLAVCAPDTHRRFNFNLRCVSGAYPVRWRRNGRGLGWAH
jgi:hypothetical protein